MCTTIHGHWVSDIYISPQCPHFIVLQCSYNLNVYNIINSPNFCKEREECTHPENLDVIIDSGGGDADAAYHIAKLFHKNFKGEITYIIPRFAKSAATLLVCGGDKIIMGPTSELGPLDPQILQKNNQPISAKSVQSTLNLIKHRFSRAF